MRRDRRNPKRADLAVVRMWRSTRLASGFGVALALLAGGAAAQEENQLDAPHWAGAVEQTDCTSSCHVPHQALGGGLNPQTGNVNLCLSCHNTGDRSITLSQRADSANRTGTSHAFDVSASDGKFGTVSPTDLQRLLRVQEGTCSTTTTTTCQLDSDCPGGETCEGDKMVCSTCHNQHKGEKAYGGRSRVSPAKVVTDLGGTGTLSSGGDFTGAEGRWYLVEFTESGDEATATFGYSKDNGTSWFGCDPGVCTTGGEPECSGCYATGSPPTPPDGVTFSFTVGSYLDGERWEFYATYPFLRRTLPLAHPPDDLIDAGAIAAGDNFCRDCHASWAMTHESGPGGGVRTYTAGVKNSHPVGVGLNANGKGDDRGSPLDGDGTADDGNPTNDLKLDQFGNVQCLTCHGVHYADSNTHTVDGP